jgi:4-amino-4-deoxy-L-arabinose transferase-like glycosyltransferase
LPIPPTLSRTAWIVVAVVMFFAWFTALDTRVLEHPDEGRYGEIAREMAVTGDWLTPRLNGLKYFEKPPLQYWVTAAAFKWLETDEWTARLAAVAGGCMTIIVVGITLARLLNPLAGAFGALVMASFALHNGISHYATLDAFFTGWMTLALCAFLRAQHAAQPMHAPNRDPNANANPDPDPNANATRNWMLLTYAALAAATMTKGPVALVIAGGSLVLYSLANRDMSPWKRLHLLPGLTLYFVLTAPWFILVSRANPEFAQFYFIHEHVARFLTNEARRPGAWYYFVPIFGFGVTPWLFIWAATFVRSWRDSAPQADGFDWMRFCMAWAIFVFVFFSLSGSKLPSYILPEYPAIALILGRELERATPRMLALLAIPQLVLAAGFLLFLMFGYYIVIANLASENSPISMFIAYRPWLLGAASVFVAGALGAWWAFRNGSARAKTLGIVVTAACGLIGFQIAFIGHEAFRPTRSSYDLVRETQNRPGDPMDPGAPVFQVGSYDQTFDFYLRRTTTLVNFSDEFALGLEAEPHKGYPKYPAWIRAWDALPQGYALMQFETYEFLAKQGVPMRVLTRDPRRVLVARR